MLVAGVVDFLRVFLRNKFSLMSYDALSTRGFNNVVMCRLFSYSMKLILIPNCTTPYIVLTHCNAAAYWRAKRALSGEVDGRKTSYFHACPYVSYVHNPRVHGRFYSLHLRRKWSSWKTIHRYARFINDEDNDC